MNLTLPFRISLELKPIIYLFEVNNRNTRAMCEIYSKLTIKIPEKCQWSSSIVFVVTLSRFCLLFWCFHCCTFEQVNSGWGMTLQNIVIISHLESLVLTLHKFGLCIVRSLRLYLLLVLHPGSSSVDFEQVNVGCKGRRITIYYEIFR